MKRILWLTDLHLNFVTESRFDRLRFEIAGRKPDALIVGGDIAEADSFRGWLVRLAECLDGPVYFVLGNHDYYKSSIAAVRELARDLSLLDPRLCWLPAAGAVSLDETTVLVGHGGWGDARSGDFLQSNVVLNDYLLIDELRTATSFDERDFANFGIEPSDVLTPRLRAVLQALGDEAAEHMSRVLPAAAELGRHIYVLMHVPPFREACWHDGRISDDNWAPHFTCIAAGHALAEFMRSHPDHQMTALCGHTHSAGTAQILPNLKVLTGAARYGDPGVQQVFELE